MHISVTTKCNHIESNMTATSASKPRSCLKMRTQKTKILQGRSSAGINYCFFDWVNEILFIYLFILTEGLPPVFWVWNRKTNTNHISLTECFNVIETIYHRYSKQNSIEKPKHIPLFFSLGIAERSHPVHRNALMVSIWGGQNKS